MTSLVTMGLTLMLKSCKLGGDAGCPGMSPRLSHSIPSFSSYLVTCLVGCTTAIVLIARMDCFQYFGLIELIKETPAGHG
jgi:hypothetical protein